ncbi:uncharacterized protein LOC110606264 [Manihot esculenta]|uniref:uncharacterized protein LOC110606264 n=1 Tax=Manihot esculenta TaxID=3983 RepID=UPI000B5D250B|nr:uncharacterized protein LOC110606264 [Manihot esculenta]
MNVVCHFNPDSVLVIEDDSDYINDRTCHVFDLMFWAYRQSIEGFKHCQPVLFIDDTFLYGKYNRCILCTILLNGNNQIFPLAFAIIEKENSDNWKAMQQDWWQPPSGHYQYCIRYILSNYNTKFKNAVMKECLRKAANHNQRRKFYETMNKIEEVNPKTFEWAVKIPLNKQTRSHYGGKRYGSMTTDTIESVNGMLKGFQALPITAMKIAQSANGHLVTTFNRDELVIKFQSAKSGQKQVVKLIEGTCTYDKFQEMCIAYSHAIAACMSRSMDYEQFVDSYNILDRIIKCYEHMCTLLAYYSYHELPISKATSADMAHNTNEEITNMKDHLLKKIRAMDRRLDNCMLKKVSFQVCMMTASSRVSRFIEDNDLSYYSDNDSGDFTKYLSHCLPKCC